MKRSPSGHILILAAIIALTACHARREEQRPPAPETGWFDFDPPALGGGENLLDLRSLNERFAGEHGRIVARDGQFVRSGDGVAVRFWGVNGPPESLRGEELRRCARFLARYGVNLVRVHGRLFGKDGEVDPERVARALEIVRAMREEGIYVHFSIYFPLWMAAGPELPWLAGRPGDHPFGLIFFDEALQARYRRWWKALLTTPDPVTGRTLASDPAVLGVELVNEDSLLFWTFEPDHLPDPQRRALEERFGAWAAHRYGSVAAALAAWGGQGVRGDRPEERRLAIRTLDRIVHDRTRRDADTAHFLTETQARFYAETSAFLRGLGYGGLVTASNWITASPQLLGPLETLSYLGGDFVDRHGYLGCDAQGPRSAWSIRDGDSYADRSALRFDPERPDAARDFYNPVMDPHPGAKPSMISEVSWPRPNRHRSEAPLFLAAYGALQGSDAIVHFALDTDRWSTMPRGFAQPWTLASPATMAQFPAAALLYRRGLVAEAPRLLTLTLGLDDVYALRGTPLPPGLALDPLRAPDARGGAGATRGPLDPLLQLAGRVEVRFGPGATRVEESGAGTLVRRGESTVVSATGELRLDWKRGVLVLDAPAAQGAFGDLGAAGAVTTRDLVVESPLDVAHVVAVALDGRPLATSRHILLQVMSEERASGFRTRSVRGGRRRIVSAGHDPWQVRELAGTVRLRRPDAATLPVRALDLAGRPAGRAGTADRITLQPRTLYYLIGDA